MPRYTFATAPPSILPASAKNRNAPKNPRCSLSEPKKLCFFSGFFCGAGFLFFGFGLRRSLPFSHRKPFPIHRNTAEMPAPIPLSIVSSSLPTAASALRRNPGGFSGGFSPIRQNFRKRYRIRSVTSGSYFTLRCTGIHIAVSSTARTISRSHPMIFSKIPMIFKTINSNPPKKRAACRLAIMNRE